MALSRACKIKSTMRYLGIKIDDTIEIEEKIDIRRKFAECGGSAWARTTKSVDTIPIRQHECSNSSFQRGHSM